MTTRPTKEREAAPGNELAALLWIVAVLVAVVEIAWLWSDRAFR